MLDDDVSGLLIDLHFALQNKILNRKHISELSLL